VERRRPLHPHPETSESGVRETEVISVWAAIVMTSERPLALL
jgi:hypothetical protein